MSIEAAFQQLVDANPVPEPAALRERPVEPRVFHRGNPESPKGDPVPPSDLSVLAATREIAVPASPKPNKATVLISPDVSSVIASFLEISFYRSRKV